MPVGGTQDGFPAYNLADTTSAAVNFRTPSGDNPAVPLPASIDTIAMQNVINDPIRLLQHAISHQYIESMVVLNIATVDSIDVTSGAVPVKFGAGGIENMPFLVTNADTALVFATLWIEKIRHELGHVLQLQYVQTVILNFPIPGTAKNLSWPPFQLQRFERRLAELADFNHLTMILECPWRPLWDFRPSGACVVWTATGPFPAPG